MHFPAACLQVPLLGYVLLSISFFLIASEKKEIQEERKKNLFMKAAFLFLRIHRFFRICVCARVFEHFQNVFKWKFKINIFCAFFSYIETVLATKYWKKEPKKDVQHLKRDSQKGNVIAHYWF